MLRRNIGRTFVICGTLMLVLGMSTLPASGAEPGLPLAQPSPRPTLVPTATIPAPTATPAPSNDRNLPPADPGVGPGHITGTIIDLSSGAPAPGIPVNVGSVTVFSDANGNYDHWLPAGAYSVALALAPDRGTPAQTAQTVTLAQGTTVVLHLNFRGWPAASAPPTPTPSTRTRPTVVHAAGAALRTAPPTRLPVTGAQPASAWLWLTLGALLLAAGGTLELRRKLSRAAVPSGYENTRLLATLLAADVRRPRPEPRRPNSAAPARCSENTALLAALLGTDAGERGEGRQTGSR